MTGFWRLAYRILAPPIGRLMVVLLRWDCRLPYWTHRLECEVCQLAIIPERRCLHWHLAQSRFDRQIAAAQQLQADPANG